MRTRIGPVPAFVACLVLLAGCSKSPDQSEPGSDSRLGATSVRHPEGPVELKIKWQVGQRRTYRMDLKQKSATHLPQRPEPMKQDVAITQEYAVSVLAERQPAGRELEFEYLFASMDVSMNNRVLFSFDSAGESLEGGADPMASLFRNMVGMRLRLLLDEHNQVETVVGLDQFINKIANNSPPRGRAVMTNMFGEDTFKQMVEFGRGLPSHPIQPGDSWSSTNEIAMGQMGRLALNLDYTFQGWERREDRHCALLEFAGQLKSKEEGGPGPMGMKMQIKEGEMSGKSWFDPELGMPVESQINQTMTMLMRASVPKFEGRGGGEQTFTTDLTQQINLKLVELSGD